MSSLSYVYENPTETYTIDQYISCQSDTDICYNNLSFLDSVEYNHLGGVIHYPAYNVISDYIDELRTEYCVSVVLTDKELHNYMYRPKLLCHRLYGSGELYFMILLINDMVSVKQFTKNKILLPRKAIMQQLCKYLFGANKQAINKYNDNSIKN